MNPIYIITILLKNLSHNNSLNLHNNNSPLLKRGHYLKRRWTSHNYRSTFLSTHFPLLQNIIPSNPHRYLSYILDKIWQPNLHDLLLGLGLNYLLKSWNGGGSIREVFWINPSHTPTHDNAHTFLRYMKTCRFSNI